MFTQPKNWRNHSKLTCVAVKFIFTLDSREPFFAAHSDRLTCVDLPPYSPEFNPIEYLWRKLKSNATHLRYFPTFDALIAKVDSKLQEAAQLPKDILASIGKYCHSLGDDSLLPLLPEIIAA